MWQVKEKIDAVLAERQKLHTAWQHKKVNSLLISFNDFKCFKEILLITSVVVSVLIRKTEFLLRFINLCA